VEGDTGAETRLPPLRPHGGPCPTQEIAGSPESDVTWTCWTVRGALDCGCVEQTSFSGAPQIHSGWWTHFPGVAFPQVGLMDNVSKVDGSSRILWNFNPQKHRFRLLRTVAERRPNSCRPVQPSTSEYSQVRPHITDSYEND
jgi:hypothetical protein